MQAPLAGSKWANLFSLTDSAPVAYDGHLNPGVWDCLYRRMIGPELFVQFQTALHHRHCATIFKIEQPCCWPEPADLWECFYTWDAERLRIETSIILQFFGSYQTRLDRKLAARDE